MLERRLWRLIHLVDATTNELSACRSLNSLCREARTKGRNASFDFFYPSLSHSRASLTTYINMVKDAIEKMPHISISKMRPVSVHIEHYIALP